MARPQAALPGGVRLSDYLSVGVIAGVFPIRAVHAALRQCQRSSQRRRALPAEAMVYYVIARGLFPGVSSRELLRCVTKGLRWAQTSRTVRLASKVAVSRARSRLGTEPFQALRELTVKPLADASTQRAWYRELRLSAFEGTTLDLPCEQRNRDEFGLPEAGGGSTARPMARVTSLVEIGTQAAFTWSYGPCWESETMQAARLLAHMGPGMLVLADCAYLEGLLWQSAAATGAELLWQAPLDTALPMTRRLADGSFLGEFGGIPTRVVECSRADRGEPRRLVTTIRDPARAPADELATLYTDRWEIDSARDEIKTTLLGRSPTLRGKTPQLARQEIEGIMLAHYAVCQFLFEVARESDSHRARFP